MIGRIGVGAALGLALLAAAAPAAAQGASAADCASLKTMALPQAAVTTAAFLPAGSDFAPSGAGAGSNPVKFDFGVCRVEAVARPTPGSDIGIVVLVPEAGKWNGKFVQAGNGGFAGQIPYGVMLLALARGYAVAGSDTGHRSDSMTDAAWALNNPDKVIDFGWRSIPATTMVAKAVTGRLGGAKRSYFYGCSDGGREALMAAQRFPQAFDGIVAGAPAWNWTRMMGAAGMTTRASLENGHNLPATKLPALQAAALAACGNGKGRIANPRACRFDPGVIACKGADSDSCLMPGELAIVRRLYAGSIDPVDGKRLPGLMPGAEALPGSWADWGIAGPPADAARTTTKSFPWNYFAYVVMDDPKLDLRALTEGDVLHGDVRWAGALNAQSGDLSAFKARGGKLLQYHGWNDPAIPPGYSLAYHDRVKAEMGDPSDFYRLFMVPGMLHCARGNAPVAVNWLELLDQWVETGAAPGPVTARGGDGATQLLEAAR